MTMGQIKKYTIIQNQIPVGLPNIIQQLRIQKNFITDQDILKKSMEQETMKNKRDMINKSKNVTDAISYATCTTAMDWEARAILSSTSSGHTARMVSKFRPDCTIIATTSHESVRRQLSLTWGVLPVIREKSTNTDQVIVNSIEAAKAANYVSENDVVVITAGGNGTTNLIKVETV